MMRFQDKTVVIATSGGSIGAACAEEFQKEGAKVAVLDLDAAEAEKLAGSDTCKAAAVKCFYDPTEVETKLAEVLETFGPADIVVTNLTAKPEKYAWNEIPEGEAHRVFDEIMTGVQTVLKYAMPPMLEKESGSVVIIENLSGRTAIAGENVMTAAAYAGLGGLIRNMATVFGKNQVTVNGVSVGPIEGEYFEENMLANAGPLLERKGTGTDVARAVMYLADPAVFWNAGEIIDLNGGRFAV